MSRHVPTRSLAAVAVALGLLVIPESVHAQIAGESVNMVTGTGWPGGDPYLQRQNEPSIAVSSANPEHLLAGANDYRTVDIAKAPADKMPGDAWAGIFKSLDGGKTWKSYLMPGYPQDPARYAKTAPFAPLTGAAAPPLMWCGVPTAAVPEVTNPDGTVTSAVPATDGTCTSAADPVVRAGADGMFYYGGITFQRFTNYGKVYLARFIDLNNKENGDATMGTDPIRFVDQKVVALGSATDFVDKPWIAVDVPRSTNPSCTVTVVNPDKTTTKRTFPGHTIYVAYLRLTNNQTQSDVMVRHSDDCGATWAAPVKVNDATSPANEGPALAIDPVKGHVYVTWRRVGSPTQPNAIMISRSFSRATKFTKPREVATVSPFDQQTTDTGFRVTLFPSSAISVDKAGVRRLHVAWAERVDATNYARVVVATKLLSPPPVTEHEEDEDDNTCQKLDRARAVDGAPITVDATPIPGRGVGEFSKGHQFMPSITFSQGKLMLVYYDTRLDHTRAYFNPNKPFDADAQGSFYEVIRGPLGAPPVSNENIPVGPDNQLDADDAVFNAFVDDGNLTKVRHTVDVRVASALPSDAPSFSAAQLSKFPFGTRGDEAYLADASGNLAVPGFGADLQIVANREVKLLQQLKVNPPNLPMFKGGTKPFFGDYIDVQGPAFVKKAGKWVFNNDLNPSPVFHAVWTSNEDVKAPPDGRWDLYAPINVQGPSRVDPTQQTVACTPATALYASSRNQNIYTSRITEGLLVSSPQNTKPLSSTQVRSFVIAAHNATSVKKTVKFTYVIPTGVTASFRALSGNQLAVLPIVTADIPPHSTVSRSLFVKSTSASATITATVTEQGGAFASGFVLLNPPGATPGLIAPDGASAITGGETYTPIQVAANLSNANLSNANLSNANLSNANLSNANLSNANLSNANLSNANLSNANLSNAALANLSNANLSNANLSNANLSNANLSNANLSNANLSNANLSNANLSNASISDLNYEYQNTGNTSTAYSIKIVGTKPNPGEVLQLIVARTYTTPTAVGCELKEEAHNHILASIDDVSGAVVSPTSKVDPGVGDANAANATVVLAPGEKVQITLRGNVTLARMAEIGATLAPRPVAQRTPIGGTTGTTTYAQYAPRGATTTALSYDGSAVFTATVKDAALAAVVSGSVNFVAAGNVFLGTVQLGAAGTATFTPVGLPSGSTVAAYYSGSNTFLPSQASLTTTAFGVTVSPATVTLAPGAEQIFAATVSGTPNQDVVWSVDGTGAGTINDAGLYIAHAVPGTYTVRATSSADPTKSGIATVTVSTTAPPPPNVTVTLSPSAPALLVGQVQTFTATVAGTTNLAVNWTVAPSTGVTFTVLSTTTVSFVTTVPGSYTVTATSVEVPAASASTTFTVSATAPGAPTGLMVTGAPGNGQVSLAWSPPASDGGSAIAGYIVTATSVAASITRDVGLTTTTTVGLLTNGVAYTFTVAAYNGVGAGSGPVSNSVTATPVAPVTAPGAPTGLTVTAGNGSATLGWTAPASDGGSAITGYDVTISPAAGAVVVTGTTASVTGLANGTAYTFTVAAINVAGTGSPSVASSAFTPATVPGVPTGLTATAGNGSATLGWTAPASNGSAISGYTVAISPAAGSIVVTGTSAAVTGLTNGTAYTFTVAAINGAGTGPASSPSIAFTPVAPVPVAVTVSPLDPGATVATPLSFAATVTGSANTAVNWSVSPSTTATISQAGSFVASQTGLYTVTATSQADPTKSASTVVTVWGAQFSTFAVSVTPSPSAFSAPVSVNVTFTAPFGRQPAGTVVISDFPATNSTGAVGFASVTRPVACTRTFTTTTPPWECSVSVEAAPAWAIAGLHWVAAEYTGDSYFDAQLAEIDTVVEIPVPVLAYLGAANRPTGGTDHHLRITNWAQYPVETFDPQTLVACGANLSPARTWVDIVDGTTGAFIYGYCAMASEVDLQDFSFFVGNLIAPPASVKVRVMDLVRSVTLESNLVAIPAPFVVPAPQAASTVAGGGNSTFFLAPGGTAMALGQNLGGQLGIISITDAVLPNPTPITIPGGVAVRSIDAASWHGMAIDVTGGLWAWGWGPAIGLPISAATPVHLSTGDYSMSVTATAISAGYGHGLVLMSNGHVWGFGDDQWGQFGPAPFLGTKRLINDPGGIVAIAAGEHHSMLLASDGTVWTMGRNEYGQLGDGTIAGVGSTFSRTTPRRVSGLTQVVAIAAGSFHSVALRTDGTVWTWGHGTEGQLGNGGSADLGSPVQVVGVGGTGFLTNVQAISTGNNHTLALLADGTLRAWGYNGQGQLGDGSTANRQMPGAVAGLASITDIAGGEWHSVARRSDGTIWAWGLNQSSQLGTGAPSGTAGSNSPVPVQIGTVTVTVTPGTASVTGGGTQAFTAVVAGAVNQAVTWSVQETNGGTIGATTGIYTAPSTPGTYHVVATSVADPTKIGTAIVTVTAPNVLSYTLTSVTPNKAGLGYTVRLTGRVIRSGGSVFDPTGTVTFTETTTATLLGTATLSYACGLGTTCADLDVVTGAGGLLGIRGALNHDAWMISASYGGNSILVPSTDTSGAFLGVDRPGVWSTVQTLPESHMGLVAVGGKLYSMGGIVAAAWQATVREFDPSMNGWTAKTPLPSAPVGPAVAAAPNGKIYVFSGSGANSTQVYDPVLDTTSVIGASMGLPRDYAVAVAVPDGRIFVIGGQVVGTGAYSDALEVFHTATETWEAQSPGLSMPTPRALASAVYWNGKIYVVGGDDGVTRGLPTVEIFDLETSTWSAGPPLGSRRRELGLAVSNGIVYAVGGMSSTPDFAPAVLVNFPAPMEVLDTSVVGAAWTAGASIQVPRRGGAAVALPWNGAIYFFGGMTQGGAQTLTGEIYFPVP